MLNIKTIQKRSKTGLKESIKNLIFDNADNGYFYTEFTMKDHPEEELKPILKELKEDGFKLEYEKLYEDEKVTISW